MLRRWVNHVYDFFYFIFSLIRINFAGIASERRLQSNWFIIFIFIATFNFFFLSALFNLNKFHFFPYIIYHYVSFKILFVCAICSQQLADANNVCVCERVRKNYLCESTHTRQCENWKNEEKFHVFTRDDDVNW